MNLCCWDFWCLMKPYEIRDFDVTEAWHHTGSPVDMSEYSCSTTSFLAPAFKTNVLWPLALPFQPLFGSGIASCTSWIPLAPRTHEIHGSEPALCLIPDLDRYKYIPSWTNISKYTNIYRICIYIYINRSYIICIYIYIHIYYLQFRIWKSLKTGLL